jgi:MoxR-like ATPase
LPKPFFVLATQNPIEQEGTYTLPEAQLDRFMFNVTLDYPSLKEEIQVIKNTTRTFNPEINKVLDGPQITYFQQLVRKTPIADNVLEYAVRMASRTRPNTEQATADVNRLLSWGAGPRASQFLVLGAKCHALISGKYSPDIEDVQAVAKAILRHRIVRSYHAEAEGISADQLVEKLF